MMRARHSKPDGAFALMLKMPYEAGMSAAINAVFVAPRAEFIPLLMPLRDSFEIEFAHLNTDSTVGEWRV